MFGAVHFYLFWVLLDPAPKNLVVCVCTTLTTSWLCSNINPWKLWLFSRFYSVDVGSTRWHFRWRSPSSHLQPFPWTPTWSPQHPRWPRYDNKTRRIFACFTFVCMALKTIQWMPSFSLGLLCKCIIYMCRWCCCCCHFISCLIGRALSQFHVDQPFVIVDIPWDWSIIIELRHICQPVSHLPAFSAFIFLLQHHQVDQKFDWLEVASSFPCTDWEHFCEEVKSVPLSKALRGGGWGGVMS